MINTDDIKVEYPKFTQEMKKNTYYFNSFNA